MRPFKEMTDSVWFFLGFSILMFLVLAYLSAARTQPVNPIFLYLILGTWLVILGANSADTRELGKLIGFKEPYSGFNAMSAILGIGIGGLVSLIPYKAATIFPGDALSIQPLYLPLALPQFSIGLGLEQVAVYIFYFFVAAFEEVMVIMLFKNLSNYFHSRGWALGVAFPLALIFARLDWMLMHYFSWPKLSILSIIIGMVFGFIFWLPYLIPDIAILEPGEIEYTGMFIIGAVTAHLVYDVIVTAGLPLPPSQFLVVSVILCVLPLVGMLLIKRSQSGVDLIPIEDQRR